MVGALNALKLRSTAKERRWVDVVSLSEHCVLASERERERGVSAEGVAVAQRGWGCLRHRETVASPDSIEELGDLASLSGNLLDLIAPSGSQYTYTS